MTWRILVVAGDPHQRDGLQQMLAYAFPAAVVTAIETGYDTLVAYQSSAIDMLILDQSLSDVRGSTLLQYLRETGITTPTILVAERLPGDATDTDTNTYFVPKPIRFTAMVGTITIALTATHTPILAA